MKASELRIGNYVHSTRRNCDFKVVGVIGERIFYGNKYSPDVKLGYEVEPIILTEAWLFKFGFVYAAYSTLNPSAKSFGINLSFRLEDVTILRTVDGFSLRHDGKDGIYAIYMELKYVHQLQNLYFALTGEELTA